MDSDKSTEKKDGLSESISLVLAVCPDADVNSVKLDLRCTGSAEQTINRIFDGTALSAESSRSEQEDLSTTDVNSDSSIELNRNIEEDSAYASSSTARSSHDNCSALKKKKGISSVRNSDLTDKEVGSSTSIVISDDDQTDVNSDSNDELPDIDSLTRKTSEINNDELYVVEQRIITTTPDKVKNNRENGSIDSVKPFRKNSKKTNVKETDGILSQKHSENFASSSSLKQNVRSLNSDVIVLDEKMYANKRSYHEISSEDENDISIHTYNSQMPAQTKSSIHGDQGLPSLHVRCKNNVMRSFNNIGSDVSTSSKFGSLYGDEFSEDSSISSLSTTTTNPDVSVGKGTKKRKRTPEEVAESKRQAMLKKEERERLKEEKRVQKERDAQMRKMESENKKSFRPGDCLKKIVASIDPGIINTNSNAGPIFKAFEELGVKCETLPQEIPNSLTWKREYIECLEGELNGTMKYLLEEDVIVMISLEDFVTMITTFSQKKKGCFGGGLTLTEFVQNLQCNFSKHLFTFIVCGVDKYFSDMKLIQKQKHKEQVRETGGGDVTHTKRRKMAVDTVISKLEMEEAMVEMQLLTGCMVKFVDNNQQMAALMKSFTKSVAEKPAKKDRLDNVFNFLEEGTAGVKVDKNGQGLLKVFKHQLMQFKNLGPDMADAILAVYPAPRLLYEAYGKCQSEKEKERLLENIMVRRGGGVLATNRRVGKEMSRRLYLFMSSTDPNFIIK